MIAFYEVDDNYISFLKLYDSKIPNIIYTSNKKFVCGVVLNINGYQYYAPISHFNKKQRTNFPIYRNQKIISTVRLCFMFPVPNNQTILKKLNFKTLQTQNYSYAQLIKYEYSYCKKNLDDLIKQAQKVYNIGTNKNHNYYNTCCNFKYLESICNDYDSSVDYSKALISV